MSTARAWLAEPHEAETVARLLVDFRDHMGHDWPSDNAFLATVERLMEHPDTEFLLAAPDEDSPPAGVTQLRFRLSVWTAAPDCWIEDVFVADHARRAGVGDALVRLAIERAAARGCRRIELDTNEDNDPAIALYHRHGFSEFSKGSRSIFMGRKIERPA
ncbi:MAG TPA: GNAT family N-acetyltransferase [Capillimicrobium sp.]|nr:GNAT family N-acetyltransferase [Capillimicrobium sp.]